MVTHQLDQEGSKLVRGEGAEVSFQQWRCSSSSVRLNVGGKIFQVSWNLLLQVVQWMESSPSVILLQVPESRLGRLAASSSGEEILQLCDSYCRDTNQIFFNHRYKNFMDILDFYRSSSLHISSDCCPMAFTADLAYWGLPVTALEACCFKRWVECKEQLEWEQAKEEVQEEQFPEGTPVIQRQLWDLFENPHTSSLARILGVISVACIFISTIILTLDTLPYFQEHKSKIAGEFAAFVIIEAIYMAYFTVEFLVRLVTCPNKKTFLRRSMNWIDLLAIVPYFITVALNYYGVTEEAMVEDGLDEGEHAGKGVTFQILFQP